MKNIFSYSVYRESGLQWSPQISSHWDVMKLSHVVKLKSGESITSMEIKPFGDFPVYGGNGHRGFFDEYTHDGEYVLIGRQGALCGNINYASGKFWASEHAVVVTPDRPLSKLWLGELLRTMNLGQYSVSAAQPGISVEMIGRLKIPFPPFAEQQKISEFISYKTSQIDRLIEKKKALIEKLNEKRIALITQAVTKGLNPDAPMKPSGVDWLGDVPAHWEVRALKYCCDFLNTRRIPLSAEERAGMARNYPYYGASGIIDEVEEYIFDEPTVLVAEDGANLLSRSTPLAFEASGKYWVNNHAHILRPNEGPFTYWSNLLCIIQYEPWVTGSAQPKLTKENLGAIHLPRPPLEEQYLIDNYVQGQIKKIDPMLEIAKTTIERLTEYRTALITAAVTGKIDVSSLDVPDEEAA